MFWLWHLQKLSHNPFMYCCIRRIRQPSGQARIDSPMLTQRFIKHVYLEFSSDWGQAYHEQSGLPNEQLSYPLSCTTGWRTSGQAYPQNLLHNPFMLPTHMIMKHLRLLWSSPPLVSPTSEHPRCFQHFSYLRQGSLSSLEFCEMHRVVNLMIPQQIRNLSMGFFHSKTHCTHCIG